MRPRQPHNTQLIRSPEVAAVLGLPNLQLYIKDESENPFHTHKDRKAWAAVQSAVAGGSHHGFCIITAGNAGCALASYASPEGIAVAAIIDHRMSSTLRQDLVRTGAVPIPVDLRNRRWTSSDLEQAASQVLDIPCKDISNEAAPYGYISDELFESISLIDHGQRHIVVVPVGGAELFVGMARRLDILRRCHGTTVELVGVRTKNPHSHADKLVCAWSPCWEEAVQYTRSDSPYQLVTVNERGLLETTARLHPLLRLEPSSALPFHALPQLIIPMSASVYVVNTGRFGESRSRLAA